MADTLLIGGGMANTFLAARNVKMGRSLVDRDSIDVARRILADQKVRLPVDLVVTDSIDKPERVEISNVDHGLFDDQMAVDIGPQTITRFATAIKGGHTIFWNGPMGVFEKEEFARGTMAVARAIAEAKATSVVGGGESVEAVKASGYADRISHISTGGGASLEFVAGQKLPGVEVLRVS